MSPDASILSVAREEILRQSFIVSDYENNRDEVDFGDLFPN